ncbi:MAG: DUF3783 domain-containing protein [Spirochaetia bacterium]
MDSEKMVFLHGFSQREALKIMKLVKTGLDDTGEIAFSMSTEKNMEWKVRDLVQEVLEEHEYMKKNPPGGNKNG